MAAARGAVITKRLSVSFPFLSLNHLFLPASLLGLLLLFIFKLAL